MPSLTDRTYQLLVKVPKGRVTTYKNLAHKLDTKAYRAIGSIMKKNPFAPEVPCHRVVRSDGKIGGYKGHKTGKVVQEKIDLLKSEGVIVKDGMVVNFEEVLF